jgi:glycosyltransferase involved in cell wall biosynthesis
MTVTDKKKKVDILLITGIPDQKNRAIYQRVLFLSKKYDVTLHVSKRYDVAPEIRNRIKVQYYCFPVAINKILRLVGFLIENLIFTIRTFFVLSRLKVLNIYTFHRGGFTAGAFLKIFFPKKVNWITDMQHTPFYYLDASRKADLHIIKRVIYKFLGWFHYQFAMVVLKNADIVVAMSFDYGEGFAGLMENRFNVKKDRLYPIPNGVDLDLIRKTLSSNNTCKYNIPKRELTFLYAGNIWIERYRVMEEIINKLIAQGIDAGLIICGAASYDAKTVIDNNSCISYLGLIPHQQLLSLYQKVDIVFVIIDGQMIDHNYSHPGKLFEALAMGNIVVASDVDSINKVITDGFNGFILKGNTREEMVESINTVLLHRDNFKEIQKNAIESVKRLDWKFLNKNWFQQVEKTFI